MTPERIPFENMSDHDLLLITAKTVNDMSSRLDEYCRRTNLLDDRMGYLEAWKSAQRKPYELSGRQKSGIIAALVSMMVAIIEYFRRMS